MNDQERESRWKDNGVSVTPCGKQEPMQYLVSWRPEGDGGIGFDEKAATRESAGWLADDLCDVAEYERSYASGIVRELIDRLDDSKGASGRLDGPYAPLWKAIGDLLADIFARVSSPQVARQKKSVERQEAGQPCD